MSWLMTEHTFLSLGWDEWVSIFTILMLLYGMIRRLTKKAKHDFFNEVNLQLRKINRNLEIKNKHDEKVDARLESGSRRFDNHELRLNDHERRIKRLEDKK